MDAGKYKNCPGGWGVDLTRTSKPDRCGSALECSKCGRSHPDAPFASLFHKVCLDCEKTIEKICACCQTSKKLTEFAICHTSGGHRERKCKVCKTLKLKPIKICAGCQIDITGQTGNTRYCEDCKAKPRTPAIPAEKVFNNTLMANFLMSPVRK